MDKNISAQLKAIKVAKKWTEVQLGAEIGASQPTVNRILNGQTGCRITTYQAIERIYRALDAPGAEPGHAGLQPPDTHNMLDAVPSPAVPAEMAKDAA
jgi:transcriptional regulator with XRE-family HTH domain